ncbi:hypothetical protein [Anaeromassilibacillus senegalensis]|uniref:hypothetical protein n=1 Tax=Anaeromassilibacillus senegalensis TaxID=1673717 RepID=UPI000680FE48|nr:hypothetical protein [Anaeromassilibacillus senegalensis]
MRKITGKALATVLAMALITSSFSGTFAFAASKTEKAGSVDINGKDEITLVKNTNNTSVYDFDMRDFVDSLKMTTADKDQTVEASGEDLSFRHAKGDTLLSINKDGKARVKSDKTGTETIMVYGEGTIDRDDKEVTLKGQAEITIHVIKSGTVFVGVKGTGIEDKVGDEIPDLEMSRNDLEEKELAIYMAKPAQDVDPEKGTLEAMFEETTKNTDDEDLRIEASNSSKFIITRADDGKSVTKIKNNNVGTGTLKLTIKGGSSFNSTEDSTTATILKRIDVTGSATVSKSGSSTRISGDVVSIDDKKIKDLSVSGYDIRLIDAPAAPAAEEKNPIITIDESVSVGNIKNDSKGKMDVSLGDKAKAGDIEDANTVSVSNSTVGEIKDATGTVTVDEGRVASINTDDDAADAEIKLNGGTVTGDVKGNKVGIDASDDEINTVVSGTVEAKDLTIEATSEDGKVQLANVVLRDDAEATISDSNIEIAKLNADYKGNVKFNSFEGKIASLVNAADVTVDEDSVVIIEGAADIENLDIAEDTSIEFRDAVTVASVSGDGKLIVPVEKLHVTDNVSGEVKLRLAGANVSVGDKAFTADKDVADVESFVGDGYKMEKKSVDKNTDAFLVKSTFFAGLALDKNEVTIAKGFSNTVTVSNYPASTSLPTGASVVWDFSDADKDIFDITADGATLNIAVKDYDDVYATSNSFDLYATVVDKDGDALEDYDSVKCTVTAIKEVPVSSDLSGIVEVPQGSTKDFVVNSSVEAPVTIGTGDVAVHAVKTPFANAQATYTIKATGAVGTTAGVYATVPGQVATKLFVIKVTAPVVTSDTTVDFDLTAGSRYVFKITAPAAPSFTVGNGAVLKTQAGKIDGNDYYFAVYAQNVAGQSTGVYVNGVKVCTVTVK